MERDFFKEPFSRAEIENLLSGKLSDEDLIALMLKEPRLIRRPVVKIGKTFYAGASSDVLAGILNH